MKVLLAEDDPNIRAGLAEILEGEGFTPLPARSGTEAWRIFERDRPDFICLDVMMPGMDGYALCRKIRAQSPSLPIIFITAKSEEIDKVLGLELGADDYIVKPFGVREVIARIRAVARRCLTARPNPPSTTGAPNRFTMGPLEVIKDELRARREAELIDLSLREVAILELLWLNRGRVVDRQTFFSRCWGLDHIPNSRTLDQHIAQLRRKIEPDPANPVVIHTVHGAGYRFDGESIS